MAEDCAARADGGHGDCSEGVSRNNVSISVAEILLKGKGVSFFSWSLDTSCSTWYTETGF